MKTLTFPRMLAVVAVSLAALATASAFGPYYSPYDGTTTVQTGKKKGVLTSVGTATTTDGTDASVVVAGTGAKGIRVNAVLTLKTDGTGSLTLDAKVLADPKKTVGHAQIPNGKKVVVKIKAKGSYTVVDANTTTFVFSGNSGKGGGTNITGTLTSDAVGNLSLTFQSGFKQFVPGLGRRIQFSFAGVSSTVP